jgi:hypothetical protein
LKTNHRRNKKSSPAIPKELRIKYGKDFDHAKKENGSPAYGTLTICTLLRNGCSPSYTGRDGARKAIQGKKKKDIRAKRHKDNNEMLIQVKDLYVNY